MSERREVRFEPLQPEGDYVSSNGDSSHFVAGGISQGGSVDRERESEANGQPHPTVAAAAFDTAGSSDGSDDTDNEDSHRQPQPQRVISSGTVDRITQRLSSQHNPERMQITPEERTQALKIKKAIEGTPDLDALTDMMYVQLAIIGKGDPEWAVNRAYKMQQYKQDYLILDTLEDSLRHIPGLVKDRFVLSVDFNLETGGYIAAYDYPKFDVSIFDTKESLRGVMQRIYYMPNLLCPDFEAVRAGLTQLSECEGFQFLGSVKGWSIKRLRTISSGGWSIYPIKYAQAKFFNSPSWLSIFCSIIKPSLSEELASTLKFGCKFPAGRLDRMYNIPSEEEAVARLCVKLEELMRRRYENERTFTLGFGPDPSP